MSLIDLSIEERGFAPASIALAVRTIGACPAMLHRPDSRILFGVGSLLVRPTAEGSYRFSTDAKCLSEGAMAQDLLDWLEPHISNDGAVISWDNWGSVPRRLLALADPARHPRIIAAAADTAHRWRDLPRGHTWHLRQRRGTHMPCLCMPNTRLGECDAALPAVLLPDPRTTAGELIAEAIGGWRTWANGFGYFDDAGHPAQMARRALDRWLANQRTPR